MTTDCWTLLGILPTDDESAIRKAYARRLRDFRPDEDPAGFQALVEARKDAILEAQWQAIRYVNEQSADHDDLIYDADDSLQTNGSVEDRYRVTPDRHASVAFDQPCRLSQLLESLELLVSALRPVVTEVPASPLWIAEPWTKLLDQAANELDFEGYEAFLQALATKVDGLFPPFARKYLTSLAHHGKGMGIAAVVDVIEAKTHFSETATLLFDHCSSGSAYTYLEWVDVARAGRNILDRLAQGKSAYFRGKVPIFPANEEPNEVDGFNLSGYYRHALELGRWPISFQVTKFFLPSYAVARYFNGPLGLLIILLTLTTLLLSFIAKTSTLLYLTTAGLCPLIAARIYFAARFKKFSILRFSKRTILADRYRIWDPQLRLSYRNSNISWKNDLTARASMPIEFSIIFIILINLLLSYGAIWREGPLYAKPAEQIVVDAVLMALDKSRNNADFQDSDFFSLFSKIRSGEANGFPLRSFSTGITAGELPNKLWLPQVMDARRRLESSLTKSREAGEPLLGVGEDRDKKLKALYFLYQAGDPSLRASIEENLLLFNGVIHRPYNEDSARWQRVLWKIVPPRQPSDLSLSDVELFHSEVLQLFISRVGTRTSDISETEILSQFRFLIRAQAPDLIAKISFKDFKPIPDYVPGPIIISDPNLPTDGLLRVLLTGRPPDTGHHGILRRARGADLPPEIAHMQNIDVTMARKVYFETALSLLSWGSSAFVLDVLNTSLANIPSGLHPSTAEFWISGAVNLVKAAKGNAEFDPMKQFYFRNETEEVKILARQIIEGRF